METPRIFGFKMMVVIVFFIFMAIIVYGCWSDTTALSDVATTIAAVVGAALTGRYLQERRYPIRRPEDEKIDEEDGEK